MKISIGARFFLQNKKTDEFLELVFVSAVAAVLLLRFFLGVTGYPQLGGGIFHISHMLWGGFMLLGALVITLSFLDDASHRIAAMVGGSGFGIFIDEIGKFITKDNNYFFEPSIAIIYIAFIVLFLAFRYISHGFEISKKEELLNVFETFQEHAIYGATAQEKTKLFGILKGLQNEYSIADDLIAAAKKIPEIQYRKSHFYDRAKKKFYSLYTKLIDKTWFVGVVIAIFLAYAALTIGAVLYSAERSSTIFDLSFVERGGFLFAIVSSVLVVAGIVRVWHARRHAYILFRSAVLISIFLTSVFTFFQYQLAALVGILGNILLLLAINYMIEQEEMKKIQ